MSSTRGPMPLPPTQGSSSNPKTKSFLDATARDAARLKQFEFVDPRQSGSSPTDCSGDYCGEASESERERVEEEQARNYQEQAQMEGAELMATIAEVAARAATEQTLALSARVDALTQQLAGLPAAVVREIPAAVRDHDEAEALRLSNEAPDSSLQRQVRQLSARPARPTRSALI